MGLSELIMIPYKNMRTIRKFAVFTKWVFIFSFILFSGCASINKQPDCIVQKDAKFEILVVLTQQDFKMDWWFWVPSEYAPIVSTVTKVTKGEKFTILPLFMSYGKTTDDEVNITYEVEILKPDKTIYHSIKNIIGFKGKETNPNIIPSDRRLIVSFEPEDPYGEYTINISAYDHQLKQNIKKSKSIKLIDIDLSGIKTTSDKFAHNYIINPKPSHVLVHFLEYVGHYWEEGKEPDWGPIWFYKQIYTDNEFLIPHTTNFFKIKADVQQKRDIILLFHLLGKTDLLDVSDQFNDYLKRLEELQIPNPYDKVTTGYQQDMLWSELFATSHIKPLRQIISSLQLFEYAGTIEKYENGELDMEHDKIQKNIMLEAVFKTAIWSIKSNCKQSPLILRYCMGLYDNGDLNEVERKMLYYLIEAVLKEIE